MFDSHDALRRHLAATRTWNGLYTAIHHATAPKLATYALHAAPEPLTGLALFDPEAQPRRVKLTGSVVFTPDDGAFILRVRHVQGTRWFTAMEAFGALPTGAEPAAPADTAPAWTWQPANRTQPGLFAATLPLGDHTQAATLLEGAPHADHPAHAHAQLTLTPASREACPATWRCGIDFLHLLATGHPTPAQSQAHRAERCDCHMHA